MASSGVGFSGADGEARYLSFRYNSLPYFKYGARPSIATFIILAFVSLKATTDFVCSSKNFFDFLVAQIGDQVSAGSPEAIKPPLFN